MAIRRQHSEESKLSCDRFTIPTDIQLVYIRATKSVKQGPSVEVEGTLAVQETCYFFKPSVHCRVNISQTLETIQATHYFT
jgi:hypothetical protein